MIPPQTTLGSRSAGIDFGMSVGCGVIRALLCCVLYLAGLGCSERRTSVPINGVGWWRSETPDVLPQILNEDLPFRYPSTLFVQRVEGNVMLRLFVDASGNVVPDSTRVVEASGYAALDSAAMAGALRLRFRAARRAGVPIAVSLLFPVHYRHPAQRAAGDST